MSDTNVLTIDGQSFNVFIGSIKRSFAVTDTDKAKRTRSGDMVRDIIGTFFNYVVTFDTSRLSQNDYDSLYSILSSPVDSHLISIPSTALANVTGTSAHSATYDGENRRLVFDAYITGGEDNLSYIGGQEVWKGLSITFTAMAPQVIS